MKLVILLAFPAMLMALAPIRVVAENRAEQQIELKDGTALSVVLIGVDEDGLMVELSGSPIQIGWGLLRVDAWTEERTELVKQDDVESWQKYGKWCSDNGLDAELTSANEEIVALGGTPLPGPQMTPSQPTPANPTTTPAQPGPTQPGPEQPNEPPLPATVTVLFSEDSAMEKELKAALKEFSVTVVDKEAETRLLISEYEIEHLETASFFGATIKASYKGSCSVSLVDGRGNVLATSDVFDTGKQSSAKDADDAKNKCRDVLANQIARWVSLRVKTTK